HSFSQIVTKVSLKFKDSFTIINYHLLFITSEMSKLYEKFIRPILFNISPETAHEFGIEALKIGLSTKFAQDLAAKRFACERYGELSRFGLKFKNPLGIAAGFDKNGVVVNQLTALGFGFTEVGTVTFNPQKGNEKPRLFRLTEDKALINRLGFNNEGTAKVVERLKKIQPRCVLGVNIGKNKDVPNEAAIENYLQSFDLAHEVADYIAVNVSSPNTPNLRELQKAENLEELLGALQKRNLELSAKPLLVKIAPDLSESEIEAIVDIAQRLKLAGIIATNTTVSRENLKTTINEKGGLSGKPLQKKSNEVIKKIYQYSGGKLPVIGVGGIFNAADAFEKIASGACLIQSYTGFIYEGLGFARAINAGLQKILREKGFNDLDAAIGSNNSRQSSVVSRQL
ncbi:MAG: quinone-dependent dihydroorotate dehydrogenase, partial [Actinomycetota bacterium]